MFHYLFNLGYIPTCAHTAHEKRRLELLSRGLNLSGPGRGRGDGATKGGVGANAKAGKRGRVRREEQPSTRAPPAVRAEPGENRTPEAPARDEVCKTIPRGDAADEALGVGMAEPHQGSPRVLDESEPAKLVAIGRPRERL